MTISVVIPVYNVAPYVERCLSSVMRQSLPATECIIVDDASTDDSVNRCRRLIDGYSGCTRFTILHHDTNRGLSAARNTGTDASTSSHIYYLDSDDAMTPDCLQKLAAPISRDDTVEMVMGSSRRDWSDMHGPRARLKQRINIKRARWQSQHPHKPLQLNSNDAVYRWYYREGKKKPNTVWNRLLKLSFVKQNNLYNREGLLLEDRLWNFYLIRCLRHAVIIPDMTYIHHQRPASIITGNTEEVKRMHRGYIFRELADHVVPGERVEETKNRLPGFLRNYAEACGNEDYEYSFNIFLNQMSVSNNKCSVWKMKLVRHIARKKLEK